MSPWGDQPSDAVDVYDSAVGPPSDPAAWSTLTLPTPRAHHASAAVGTKLICARGRDVAYDPIVDADIYDFATGTWSTVSQSAGGSGAVAVTVGTKVLIAGGFTFTTGAEIVDIYDDATGARSTAVLSEGRGGHLWEGPFVGGLGAAVVGDLAFFAGGLRRRPDGGYEYSGNVDIYDDSTGTWTSSTLHRARDGVSVAAIGDKVLFAGGAVEFRSTSDVDVYDVATGLWSTTRLQGIRRSLPGLTLGDSVHFAGGNGG